MGAANLTSQTLVGEGLYGAVYRNTDGSLTKKLKMSSTVPSVDSGVFRELRAYDWIDTIDNPAMLKFFARRLHFCVRTDRTYTHVPRFFTDRLSTLEKTPHRVTQEDTKWLLETKQKLAEVNSYPYVYEIVMQDKGRPLNPALITPQKLKKAIGQAFRIVHFMQQQEVIHSDLHTGNFVMQSTGDLALIDYGEVHMKGDAKYASFLAEHVMLMQLTSMMVDITNNFDIEGNLADASQVTTLEQRCAYALSISEMATLFTLVCASVKYDWETAIKDPYNHDFLVAVLFNSMKVMHPTDFKKMMGWPDNVVLHIYFGADDIRFVYLHLGNIPAIIQYFENQ